jgi:hypothetical protein
MKSLRKSLGDKALQRPEDLRTTLFVSEKEALLGSTRIVTLPSKRRVTFSIPAGVHDGEQIRLDGEGLPSLDGGPPSDLIITIMYRQTREFPSIHQSDLQPSPETHPSEEMPTGPLRNSYSVSPSEPDIENMPTNPVGSNRAPPPDSANIGDIPPLSFSSPQRNVLVERLLSRQALLIILLLLLVIVVSAGLLITTVIYKISNGNSLAVATATRVTRTAQAAPSFPFSKTLLLSDPLRDNSKGKQWEEDGDSSGSCRFSGGAYHVSIFLQDRFHGCIALNLHASNFTYEVQMRVIKGDCGGLILRRSGPKFYYFRVCVDGSYAFIRYASDTNIALNLTLTSGTHPAIHRGLNQENVVAVVASGSKLDLYVNRQLIAMLQDSSYMGGQIGLIAKARANATETVFSNLMLWML